MTLEELLKDKPDVLNEVKQAIEGQDVKFVDIKEGGYVDKNKYTDLETRYNALKNKPNPLEGTIETMKADHDKAIKTERSKLSTVAKKLAIDSALNNLGIEDELTLAGIRSLIKPDKIKLDEHYNISEGLQDQIDQIKEQYKDSFVKPSVVSTGRSLPISGKVEPKKKYTSAEIDSMSLDEMIKNIDAVNASLGEK
jgi:hypothetical protein